MVSPAQRPALSPTLSPGTERPLHLLSNQNALPKASHPVVLFMPNTPTWIVRLSPQHQHKAALNSSCSKSPQCVQQPMLLLSKRSVEAMN